MGGIKFHIDGLKLHTYIKTKEIISDERLYCTHAKAALNYIRFSAPSRFYGAKVISQSVLTRIFICFIFIQYQSIRENTHTANYFRILTKSERHL